MMKDVDALTRQFGPLVAQHMMTADILSPLDRQARLVANVEKLNSTSNITKVTNGKPDISIPIIVYATFNTDMNPSDSISELIAPTTPYILSSLLMMLHSQAPIDTLSPNDSTM